MSDSVFNRYEIKFMVNQKAYEKIIKVLEQYMVPDEYSKDGGLYSICNIYYDTENDRLIRKSIEKPVYKEKIRLRSYGKPDEDSFAFIEIKKKFKGNVNKRRITLPLREAVAYLDYGTMPESIDNNLQIFKEIEFMLQRYKPVPKVYISYDRRAYFGVDDRDLRVTFDTNIQTRRTDLNLTSGAYGKQLLAPGYWLMEVKISHAMPLWLSELLSENKIYKTSFSKYGMEYTSFVQNTIKEGDKVICLNQYSQQLKPQFQQARQF